MKTIEKLVGITITGLKNIIRPTDGTMNIINFPLDIAHHVKSNISPLLLRLGSMPTNLTEVASFKIPKGTVLTNLNMMFDTYKDMSLTQHQVMEYVNENWNVLRENIHAVVFISEVGETDYCLFYFIVSDQKQNLMISILPVNEATSLIEDNNVIIIVPKKD
jgi:hypothetical protein